VKGYDQLIKLAERLNRKVTKVLASYPFKDATPEEVAHELTEGTRLYYKNWVFEDDRAYSVRNDVALFRPYMRKFIVIGFGTHGADETFVQFLVDSLGRCGWKCIVKKVENPVSQFSQWTKRLNDLRNVVTSMNPEFVVFSKVNLSKRQVYAYSFSAPLYKPPTRGVERSLVACLGGCGYEYPFKEPVQGGYYCEHCLMKMWFRIYKYLTGGALHDLEVFEDALESIESRQNY
jgi:hypothetical protein